MRPRHRAAASVLLFAAFAPALLAASAADSAPPNAHRLFELRLTKPAMTEEMFDNVFSLPQFRVYDAAGAQVLDLGNGYDHESFDRRMRATLARPEKTGSTHTLAEELARFEGAELSDLPAAELTIVELWAEWCVPCHELNAQLTKILAGHSERRIDRLHVNANPEKILGTAATIGEKKPVELPDEIQKQIADPNLSVEERTEIVRRYLRSQKKADETANEVAPPKP